MTSREADDITFEALREHFAESDTQCVDWCPVCRTADLWREFATPELREQWSAVQREALIALRTLIDHYIERADRPEDANGRRAEDIRIE